MYLLFFFFFFFQAEDGIRDLTVTGVQTCALPIFSQSGRRRVELERRRRVRLARLRGERPRVPGARRPHLRGGQGTAALEPAGEGVPARRHRAVARPRLELRWRPDSAKSRHVRVWPIPQLLERRGD